jgi:hypothetical protein
VLEPEEVAWRLFNSAKLKAKKRQLDFDIKYNDVYRQVKRGSCPLSGITFDHRAKPLQGPDLPFRASLDRIDNTRGYFEDNILVIVKIANHAKWNWNQEDLMKLAHGLVKMEMRNEQAT